MNERELLEQILEEVRGIRQDRREFWKIVIEIIKSVLGQALSDFKGRFRK